MSDLGSGHTPGPWQGHDRGTMWRITGPLGEPICYLNAPRTKHIRATRLKDARVISAAPDLLAALQECRRLLDGDASMPEGVRGRADAAIAKATQP